MNYNGQTVQKTDHFFHSCTPHCASHLLLSDQPRGPGEEHSEVVGPEHSLAYDFLPTSLSASLFLFFLPSSLPPFLLAFLSPLHPLPLLPFIPSSFLPFLLHTGSITLSKLLNLYVPYFLIFESKVGGKGTIMSILQGYDKDQMSQ